MPMLRLLAKLENKAASFVQDWGNLQQGIRPLWRAAAAPSTDGLFDKLPRSKSKTTA